MAGGDGGYRQVKGKNRFSLFGSSENSSFQRFELL
jgi:hypothetical protein